MVSRLSVAGRALALASRLPVASRKDEGVNIAEELTTLVCRLSSRRPGGIDPAWPLIDRGSTPVVASYPLTTGRLIALSWSRCNSALIRFNNSEG